MASPKMRVTIKLGRGWGTRNQESMETMKEKKLGKTTGIAGKLWNIGNEELTELEDYKRGKGAKLGIIGKLMKDMWRIRNDGTGTN